MSKLKYLLLLVLVAISLITFDLGSTQARISKFDRYILPGEAVFPESIGYRPRTKDFFVSSTTDGSILRGNLQQESAEVFLPGGVDGRTTAIGVKVDNYRDRLFIAGGGTGQIFVYDIHSGNLLAKFNNHKTPTFINDLALTPNGDAYFTDSSDPILYKVFTNDAQEFVFEAWLDFTGTSVEYQSGFNLNGIAATKDGKYLIVVQTNTGKLFRIDIASKEVTEIDLGGETLTNGDGIFLSEERILYVARNRNGLIVKVKLSRDFSRGTVVSNTTDPLLAYPTAITQVGKRLLVVNSQFDKRGPGLTPELPFTVASIPAP